ncbi:MAG: response regulator transcription factor [Anaerolineales bacterium]|nr:response regulator transcription factor [Anaerolineales bacterium]
MAGQAVLVIEDDPNWQRIYSEIITDAGFEAQIVTTYGEALTALANRHYALAIVDMSLSEADYANRDGLRVLRQIAGSAEPLPAIVVTGYATVNLAVETLVELKAVHFFRKDEFDRRKFRQTLEKEAQVKSEVVYQSQHIPASFRQKLQPAVTALLSERELEVLYYLSQGQTNKEIGERLVVTVNTVKKHTQSIFTKLRVNNRAAAVAQALNVKDY